MKNGNKTKCATTLIQSLFDPKSFCNTTTTGRQHSHIRTQAQAMRRTHRYSREQESHASNNILALPHCITYTRISPKHSHVITYAEYFVGNIKNRETPTKWTPLLLCERAGCTCRKVQCRLASRTYRWDDSTAYVRPLHRLIYKPRQSYTTSRYQYTSVVGCASSSAIAPQGYLRPSCHPKKGNCSCTDMP